MKNRPSILARCAAGTAALGLLLATMEANAQHDVYLVAKEGTVALPGGGTLPIWGFVADADGDLATDGAEPLTSLPGPEIRVPAGETTLNINVRNDLPLATGEPVSIVIPGQTSTMIPVWDDGTSGSRTSLTQRVRSFTHETALGGTSTYTFTGLKPGTYLYQSGTHPQVQVQMGLYGAMIQDSGAGEAYPGVAYGEEVVLLYSELDPALHNAVEAGDYGPGGLVTSTVNYDPRYFLVNGVAYEAGQAPIGVDGAGGGVLLRWLNAGLESRAPTTLGVHMSTVAEDGNPYTYPREEYNVFLPAGKTHDSIVPIACAVTPGMVPIWDATLDLANDGGGGAGGMLVKLSLDGGMCDNCPAANNPDQRDTDGDGFGDSCDGDFNNNGTVDFGDAAIMRGMLGTTNPAGDFNNNGVVDFGDAAVFRGMLGLPPG